jgi:flagellar secretion chaperone FliS
MMNPALQRARYLQDAVETASPARLLTMLYDRLMRDLAGAELAITTAAHAEANALLLHAQEIILELQVSLDPSVWSGAKGLSELYSYLYAELIAANTTKDAKRVAVCARIVEPLRSAWHEAAATVAGTVAVAV